MTNYSKCEVCRARKIKCDEKRPSCGPCDKKGQTCHYNNDNDSVFVHEQVGLLQQDASERNCEMATSRRSSSHSHNDEQHSSRQRPVKAVTLRLKRSHKAESGSGEFLTFGRTSRQTSKVKVEPLYEKQEIVTFDRDRSSPSLSPCSPLLCPQDLLAAKWISISGPESLHLYPLGNWIRLAWDRVGSTDYLDQAIQYALASMTAFQRGSQDNMLSVRKMKGRALKSLRQAVLTGSRSLDLCVAMMLHYATEHFRGMITCYWVSHMSAASELLASLSRETTKSKDEGIIQSIRHATIEDEVTEAILNGQISMLEGTDTDTSVLGVFELDIALSELDRLFAKVPRLVLLVRTAVQDPNNHEAARAAIELADQLYNSQGARMIDQTVSNIIKTTPTSPSLLPSSPVPTSFQFDSMAAFILANRYFLFRIWLCALVQTICSWSYPGIPFDREKAEADDMAAAYSILQCVEWAFKPDASGHLISLRMMLPIQTGFGAWHRLQKRQSSSDTLDYEYALRMKAWHIEVAHQIDQRWNNRMSNYRRLEGVCDMWAGGPLKKWMYNYRTASWYDDNAHVDLYEIPAED